MYIKQVLVLALTTVSFAGLGFAAACGSGTLAVYDVPGFSCTIGGDTLSSFQLLTGTFGNTELSAGLVTITPNASTYFPSISISVNQTAVANASLETMFTYDISGSLFTGIAASLSGASEVGNGGVSAIVNFCEGGNFGPDGVDGCTKANDGFALVDGALNSQSEGFSRVPFVAVTDDFEIDGPASGGTVTNSFTAVPEPMSTSLAGFGLALLGVLKVRSIRAKQESK
jgi:hypothetical protein